MSILSVYAVFANAEQAERVGRTVVEERLAACVNILGPIRSIYRWQGKIETAKLDPSRFGVEFGSAIADALVHRLPDLAPDMAPIDAETRKQFHDANVAAVEAINAFLPARERLRLDPAVMPIESDTTDRRLSEAQAEVIRSVFPSALSYRDGIVLRDIAMKYESGEPLTRDEGIALMQYAQKARPHGKIIAGKLKEWRGA